MTLQHNIFENETPEQRKRQLKKRRQTTYRKRQKTKHQTNPNPIGKQNGIGIKRHELGRL